MGIDLRLPNITGATEREQLVQIRSYLYQLSSQLQWALNTIETPASQNVVVANQSPQKIMAEKSEDAEATFNSIKALIIKSADIVDAYYEEVNNRLTGLYVAQSDFGEYIEATEAKITANSKNITQHYTDLQNVIPDLEKINFTLAESQAHIKSGALYEDDDGLPVYGLEIGQRNTIDGKEVFNKYARFTAGRLSFYDQNDREVAYISDYKLYITHVEIIGSLKGGGFLLDFSKGFRLKHVGRG